MRLARSILSEPAHISDKGTLMDQETHIAIDEVRTGTRHLRPAGESLGNNADRTYAKAEAKLDRYIALVEYIALAESRTFMQECMHRGMAAVFSLPVVTYSTLSELERQFSNSVALILLSLTDAREAECAAGLKVLLALDPSIPIVVLATANDMDLTRTAINYGAKGYIPCRTKFEIAVDAVRFILAGGTYVPTDCLLASAPPSFPASQASQLSSDLTAREVRVVQAIQEGKSNKVIAYQLGICEATVKVHLRNVMKKLKAKNRTEVAIKAQTALRPNNAGVSFGITKTRLNHLRWPSGGC